LEKNGAGKSAMLEMLVISNQTLGDLSGKRCSNGILRQESILRQGRTVLEEAYETFTEIKIVREKQKSNHQLVTRTDYSEQILKLLKIYRTTHIVSIFFQENHNYVGDTEILVEGLVLKRCF
jgi:ATP-binding cassette subfamily F protein 3